MSDVKRGVDAAGRRSKRFLSVSQKYEIWLQLVRQEGRWPRLPRRGRSTGPR
jgi:hypothetical protein